MERKNAETISPFETNVKTRFQGILNTLSQGVQALQLSGSEVDAPIPVTLRAIGFSIADLFKRVRCDRDVRDKVDTDVTAPIVYRILSAKFEYKLLKNYHIINSPFKNKYYNHQPDVEDLLKASKNVNIMPPAIAVCMKLINPIKYYDLRYIALRPKNPVSEEKPVPECVYFSNLKTTVNYLAANQDAAFRNRSPLPGAVWNDEGRLANPHDFWPENYDLDSFRSDVIRVNEWLLTIETYRPRWVSKNVEDEGGSYGLFMSAKSGSVRVDNDIVVGDVKDFYSVIPMKDIDEGFGIHSLLGENPSQGSIQPVWGMRDSIQAHYFSSASYLTVAGNID